MKNNKIKIVKIKDTINTNREHDDIIKTTHTLIENAFFGCQNETQVECSISFARFLYQTGINANNYLLFLKMLETNNKWIVDELINTKEPNLLFTHIPSNSNLIKKAFNILAFWHPGQIYYKVLSALLGIIESSYYDADDGYKMYKLQVNDINTIGKYLDKSQSQEYITNRIILDILHRISQLGEYDNIPNKSIIAKHAFGIRFSFFDERKELKDVIPQLLLVKIERTEIAPSKEYIEYLGKNNLTSQ